ncbi:xanthine dehydrogenase family protein molybdopterin-binding subunit [Streptosporangium sp. NPDC020145]|uniref:xanthine dehydrogenase family protein molybdopterin-binding subunit n=1 Tax=Streptosporangium sp. NPDC020145 TaxID=3154694 RepID=UPI0034217FC1
MTGRTTENDRPGTPRGSHETGRGHEPQGPGPANPADLPRNHEPDEDHEADEGREVGRARRRKEDARLVTGRTTWTDNIRLPGMLYVAFLRAPMAHARITRVDTSAARSRPGVVAAFHGQDFAGEQGSLPCAWPVTEDVVIPDHRLRVIAPDVGGGFGSKLQVTAEEVLALLLTRRLGRPVKWTESRSEGNLTVHHGRDQLQRIRLAAERDGRLRAVQVELLADMGAYLMLVTPGVPLLGAFMYGGIYKMNAYDFTCTGVFTTKMPTDACRGAGRPEAAFAIERAMDELAHELGLDPVEVRRRNWTTHEDFPYTTVCGLTYDSGNYEAATDQALELFGYDALRAEQARRRAERDPVQLGIGVSTFTEMCGIAPSRVLGSLNYGAGGWEHASVRVLPTGKVEVVTGTSPHGQGHETAWSQIAADALGVPFEDVSVLHGDTAVSHKGMDTYGSRSLVVGGVAVLSACEKLTSSPA